MELYFNFVFDLNTHNNIFSKRKCVHKLSLCFNVTWPPPLKSSPCKCWTTSKKVEFLLFIVFHPECILQNFLILHSIQHYQSHFDINKCHYVFSVVSLTLSLTYSISLPSSLVFLSFLNPHWCSPNTVSTLNPFSSQLHSRAYNVTYIIVVLVN